MSLTASLLGLLLFPLGWLAARLAPNWFTFWVFCGGFVVSVVLEAAAVGFGLAARRTGMGKAGLALSLVALTLFLGLCCFWFSVLRGGMTGRWG
jgi:hypothetical protein